VTSVPARARVFTWLAAIGIGLGLLIMLVASLVRGAWMLPHLTMPAVGPPWEVPAGNISADVATIGLWIAAVLGAGGVALGLLAVARGARPSPRILIITGVVVTVVLTVLPPAGSTDALDYAAYGRLLALGHNPYTTTPYLLIQAHNAFSTSVPHVWDHYVSVYGPVATMEQYLAAKLGGDSPARITFWLKLWNSAAFLGVVAVLDRLLHSDPARRLRAHLLWTVNPLLLWDLVAAGHLDVLAAAAGLLGVVVLGKQAQYGRPSLGRVLAAGALLGLAADIKINYAIFGLGVGWALRRSRAALATAAAAALVVLVPTYAAFGLPAFKALAARRNQSSADNFYRVILPQGWQSHVAVIATILVIAMMLLAMQRLPAGYPALPAVRPIIAISAAWLFLWPYQLPWYDAMIIVVLVLFPASRLDWLVILRLLAGTVANMPGNPYLSHSSFIRSADHYAVHVVAPAVLVAAAIGLVALCVTGAWKLREPDGPPFLASPDSGDVLIRATG
jgi:hypothetical protein